VKIKSFLDVNQMEEAGAKESTTLQEYVFLAT
jgi:hypothetical protein